MKTALVVGVGAAILAVAAVVAFRPTGNSHSVTSPTAFDLPALSGGGRVRLADYRGTPVVVNLFASWCAECRTELPAFARAARDLHGRVQFVGIDSLETGDGRGMADEYHLAAAGFALAKDVGRGGGDLHQALSAPGMPVTIFYDSAGRILVTYIASLPESTLREKLTQYYGAA